jgi:hypothetical protein
MPVEFALNIFPATLLPRGLIIRCKLIFMQQQNKKRRYFFDDEAAPADQRHG